MGDGVNDVALRADWRARGGLCSRHWRVWRSLDTPALSSAVLLRDLLESALAPRPARAHRRTVGVCPACERETAGERRTLAALLNHQGMSAAALAAGRAVVCLRHTEALPAGVLRAGCEAKLRALLSDVEAFIRTQDHRFAAEPIGDAGDAWLRAIRAFGGDV